MMDGVEAFQREISSKGYIAARTLAVAAKLGYGVDAASQAAAMGMAAIGASRPLRRIPAIVSFLNPQPALSLVSGNRF